MLKQAETKSKEMLGKGCGIHRHSICDSQKPSRASLLVGEQMNHEQLLSRSVCEMCDLFVACAAVGNKFHQANNF